GDWFPLAWDLDSSVVPAVNVSSRYALLETNAATTGTIVHVRLREKSQGERLAATVELRSNAGELLSTNQTPAGTADLNDMPEFTLPPNADTVTFRFARGSEAREKVVPCAVCMQSHTLDFAWDELKPVPKVILAAEAWLAQPVDARGAPPELAFTREE